MKWILSTLIFTVLCTSAHAQDIINITFDDSAYRSYIFIDTINFHHNLWQVGKPHKTVFDSAYSAPNVLVTDTSLPYAANDTSVFILKVPKYLGVIGGMPFIYMLSVRYQLNLDSNAKARIEFSGDGGLTWKDLLKGDTTHTLTWGAFSGGTKPNFDTSTHGWQLFNVSSFSDFKNGSSPDTTLFRFSFLSGNNDSAKDGWMIDDIQIVYYSEGLVGLVGSKQLCMFPNPATNELTISSADMITSVTISNLQGQTLYSNHYHGEKQVQIDVAGFPAGGYFIKINGSDVRRFVKR